MKKPPEKGSAEFRLGEKFDVPELLGASWWLQSLVPASGSEDAAGASESAGDAGDGRRVVRLRPLLRSAGDMQSRRQALQRLLLIGGGVAGVFTVMGLARCAADAPPRIDSQQLQRNREWNFGARSERLAFPDAVTRDSAGDRVTDSSMAQLAAQLRPTRIDLVPFYVPTLFQAPAAQPSLAQAVVPINSDAMQRAFAAGVAIADLFAPDGAPRDVALVVDLPGPEAVAFAAGAAARFAPVFVFDNWPHPLGVVPAHLTLAAALYHRPRLYAPDRDARPPMFVLDRARLSPYHDEPDRFDNRYLARLPSAEQLRGLRMARALYVAPTDAAEPLDDLDNMLALWREGGIEVRMLGCDRFEPAPPDPQQPVQPPQVPQQAPAHYYGHRWGPPLFWFHYPWWTGPRWPQQPSPPPRPRGASFEPVAHLSRTRALAGTRVGTVVDPDPPTSSRGGSWGRSGGRSFGG